jgi:hypothetical protein
MFRWALPSKACQHIVAGIGILPVFPNFVPPDFCAKQVFQADALLRIAKSP